MQNINPEMRDQADNNNTITVPGGVDANLLMNALVLCQDLVQIKMRGSAS